MNEFDDYQQDDAKTSKKDIEIVPENRRMNRYPNHKYTDDKEPINTWSSKSFASKKRHYPSNVQDVILRGTLTGQKAKGLNEMQIASGSSMRLKGIYKQSGLPESHLEENYRYSKEINNLMQNDSGDSLGGGKTFMRNFIRGRGVPFRLPAKGREKPNLRLNQKRQPITIYLDFYPMNAEQFRRKKPKSEAPASPESEFGTLVAKESINMGKFLPPEREQGGIILQLNLYPKESATPEKKFKKPTGGFHSGGYNKKAERKTFGWFSKHKKEKHPPKECTFAGLNPHGKHHIKAKWKNEKGEWIHSEHVAVKYLKKENESSKR